MCKDVQPPSASLVLKLAPRCSRASMAAHEPWLAAWQSGVQSLTFLASIGPALGESWDGVYFVELRVDLQGCLRIFHSMVRIGTFSQEKP